MCSAVYMGAGSMCGVRYMFIVLCVTCMYGGAVYVRGVCVVVYVCRVMCVWWYCGIYVCSVCAWYACV